MSEKNIDWDDLQLFLAVAREGGLSPAARVTGRSAATLGRRMLALERSLGQELFVRHDRGYEPTAEAQRLLQGLTDVEARIARLTSSPRGAGLPLVKISVGTWTTLALLDRLDGITGNPPDLRVRFISGEHSLNISHREAVIGIRNARPTGVGLAGRRLARVEFAPYARKDAPDRWILVLADTPSARWLKRTVGDNAVCEVNAPRNSLDLALAGRGISLLPTFIGDSHEALKRRGGGIAELEHDSWIVTHQDDRHLPEVRRAIDRICRILHG